MMLPAQRQRMLDIIGNLRQWHRDYVCSTTMCKRLLQEACQYSKLPIRGSSLQSQLLMCMSPSGSTP